MTRQQVKPLLRQDMIVDYLRCQIISNRLAPGSRLPTRAVLEKQFNVSSVTVQRALDRLIADGFVEPRGRHGTYVSDYPPHLCLYGLIFPFELSQEPSWSHFWRAMYREAEHLLGSGPRRFNMYFGLESRSEDYYRLLEDIRAQRLAGLILVIPNLLSQIPVSEAPEMPRVVLTAATLLDGCHTLEFDQNTFLQRALDHFVARGRRRVAIFTPGLTPVGHTEFLLQALTNRGLISYPYWIQGISPSAAVWAAPCAHLLMHEGQSERPDAILITDDHLVEHVSEGLYQAGVRAPDDLDIVAHCNYPWPTPSVLPARRLGYDVRQVLRASVEIIDRCRKGDPTPIHRLVSPLFEEEVSAA